MNTYRRFSNAAAPYNLYLFEQRLIIKSSLKNVIIISNNKSLNSVKNIDLSILYNSKNIFPSIT